MKAELDEFEEKRISLGLYFEALSSIGPEGDRGFSFACGFVLNL